MQIAGNLRLDRRKLPAQLKKTAKIKGFPSFD